MKNINRDSEGKYTSYKSVMFKWFGVPALFVIVGVGSAAYYYHKHPIKTPLLPPIVTDVSGEMFSQKIDTLEKSLVKQVEVCESGGYSNSDALVTYDPKDSDRATDAGKIVVDKGQMSYGQLQFKVHTVIYYYKTLYSKTITNKDAILIALDATSSEALAKDIMFTSPNMSNDWAKCSNKLNLNVMIQAIKQIK